MNRKSPEAKGLSRQDALGELRTALSAANVESAALDARVLLQEALGIDAATLAAHPDRSMDASEAARLAAFAARRLAGEPVARILGRREFWGMSFALSPATLVPRPETETVVTTVLARLRDAGRIEQPLSIVDLGTGSGCLLVALLAELPHAVGLGIDRSAEAAATARANAAANGVGGRAFFAVSDWAASVDRCFDVIVSNPPYVAAADLRRLPPEVRLHDPRLALDGGDDGLDAYRSLAADLPRLLAPDGFVALELGAGQAREVRDLLVARGLAKAWISHDLSGVERVVAATR